MVDKEPTAEKIDTTYEERIKEEIEHYAIEFQSGKSLRTLTQSVPSSWGLIEQKNAELTKRSNQGRSFPEEIIAHIKALGGGSILSIGSGPGGVELSIASQLADTDYGVQCLDLNPKLIELGSGRARQEGLRVDFAIQDINDIALKPEQFDVIMCHASLHHLLNLEHVFYEINRALKFNGELVIVDIVTRNGYLMWNETFEVVRGLWCVLPRRLRYNHTSYSTRQLDEEYENRDYGSGSMECIRSEAIIPLLDEYLERKVLVPSMSISRRFFDTMYGPNYDLSKALDRSIVEFIWELDVHYINTGTLKPETVFGVYTKKVGNTRPPKFMATGSDTSP